MNPSDNAKPENTGSSNMSKQKRLARKMSKTVSPNPSSRTLPSSSTASRTAYGAVSPDEEGGYAPEEDKSELRVLYDLITGKSINLLLVFMPFGYMSSRLHWPDQYVFWLNFLAMVPLASILGDFTEELAMHTNQVIGGLINATFGNVSSCSSGHFEREGTQLTQLNSSELYSAVSSQSQSSYTCRSAVLLSNQTLSLHCLSPPPSCFLGCGDGRRGPGNVSSLVQSTSSASSCFCCFHTL